MQEAPCLLVDVKDWARLRAQRDPYSVWMKDLIRAQAERLLAEPVEPVVPDANGLKRMLLPARRKVARILVLAMARHLTCDNQFAHRAAGEIEAALALPDWHPEHFLDTAEMSVAVALGLNWLQMDFSEELIDRCKEALVEKALRPSFDSNWWWLEGTNNWTQVCHAGLTAAALAIAHWDWELAHKTIVRAIAAQARLAENQYAPDGVYPEGVTYWEYGTSYSVLLIALLKKTFGRTFELDAFRGFLESADYVLQMDTPTGGAYYYGDCPRMREHHASLFWFASHYQRPILCAAEWGVLEKRLAEAAIPRPHDEPIHDLKGHMRFWPLALLWHDPELLGKRVEPLALSWIGQGEVPVAVARTAWNDQRAAFFGIKGGRASISHGHMDVGSFIYENRGTRWAVDLGMEKYELIEETEIDVWNAGEGGDRWRVFRPGPESHNILRFDAKPPLLHGTAKALTLASEHGRHTFTVDLSAVYAGQVESVCRKAVLMPDGNLEIEDTWAAGEASVTVRWQWLTDAEVEIEGETASLRQNGETLVLRFTASSPVTLRVEESAQLENSWDLPNPGVRRLSAEIVTPGRTSGKLQLSAHAGS